MPATAPLTQAPPSDPSEADRTARQLRQLAELSELAMELARTTQHTAKTHPTPENKAAFATAARTVTRIIALENWLTRPHPHRTAAQAKEQAATTARQTASLRHETNQIIAVTPFIPRDQRYRCQHYLSGLDLGADLGRPIPELIARICRALSIPVPADFAAPPPEPPASATQPSPPPPPQPAFITPPGLPAAHDLPIPPD